MPVYLSFFFHNQNQRHFSQILPPSITQHIPIKSAWWILRGQPTWKSLSKRLDCCKKLLRSFLWNCSTFYVGSLFTKEQAQGFLAVVNARPQSTLIKQFPHSYKTSLYFYSLVHLRPTPKCALEGFTSYCELLSPSIHISIIRSHVKASSFHPM